MVQHLVNLVKMVSVMIISYHLFALVDVIPTNYYYYFFFVEMNDAAKIRRLDTGNKKFKKLMATYN